MIRSFQELACSIQGCSPVTVGAVWPHDEEIIKSLILAKNQVLVSDIFVFGNSDLLKTMISTHGGSLRDFRIITAQSAEEASMLAVAMVKQNTIKILVKGSLKTETYVKSIINKETGITISAVLSNISLFEMKSYHKFLALTDNGLNIAPDLNAKKAIIENTLPLWDALEIPNPKLGILAAIEQVNHKMSATVDAAALQVMAQNGQIKKLQIEGPLGYDCLIDAHAAIKKGIISHISGDIDCILAPTIETANALGKSYKYHGLAAWGGVICGAAVPCILNSRSDDAANRYNSFLIARALLEKSTTYKP